MAVLGSVGRRVASSAGVVGNHVLTNGGLAAGRGMRGAGLGVLLGGAVIAGAGRALTDPDGVYQQQVFPNAQELAFGNPRMVQQSMRAGLTAAISMGADEEIARPTDYYYSRPVNLRGNDALGIPVSGEMVFGMYNLRR